MGYAVDGSDGGHFHDRAIVEHEDPNACIHDVEGGKYRRIQGCDDSGPVGPKCPFLVLNGGCRPNPTRR